MNAYAKALFELGSEAMQLAALAAAGLPVDLRAHERHAAEADELRTEGRVPSPRLSELPNPHD